MPELFDLTRQGGRRHRLSRGIGRAIAEQMAAHGAKVVVSSRKLPACEEVVKAINEKYGEGTRDRRSPPTSRARTS